MRVLFVAGANTKSNEVISLVKTQGNSLEQQGIDIYYFPIHGSGLLGYLKNVPKLKRCIKDNQIDIIHSHFSYSGLLSNLANRKTPKILSLLGSDLYNKNFLNRFIWKFTVLFKNQTLIVKSPEMEEELANKNVHVIPNGVDMNLFKPMDRNKSLVSIGWTSEYKHILFAANPKRKEKNFKLAEQAINLLNKKNIKFHTLNDVEHQTMPLMFNSSSVIILTSKWEGSPNVIKEAMACNIPIVATNVGDIEWLFGDEPGHYLADFTAEDFSKKLKLALDFSENCQRTNGRSRLISLGLDSDVVAKRIIGIYECVLEKQ